MSISSIAGAAGTSALQFMESLVNPKTAQTGSSTSADSNGTADLSQIGQFFSKLESLAQTSPDQFKQLTAQISSELSSAAQQATGGVQQFLQNLADKFQTASQTGSTASLQPTQDSAQATGGAQGAHHHHHHHHGYSSSDGSSGSTDLLSALSGSSSNSTAGGSNDIGSLFQNIYQQVMQA